MAKNDIEVFDSSHGGHERILHYRMGGSTTNSTADTSWRKGEVLLVDAAAGDVNVIDDGAEDATALVVVAAAGSDDLIQTHNGTSGAATHNIMVPCYALGHSHTEFKTKYVFNNSDTQVAVSTLFVGDTCGFWRDNTAVTGLDTVGDGANGRFGLDQNGTGLVITRILDANGRDVGSSGGTGTVVVFRPTVG